ncbi:BspA family leucine-rich repeat surface protein [Bifidobacterium sp. ESL0690]|uniref:BspA family leucine-rich repeat surface protein n=1 Tax=Bifidobacterium sp. ESL0690 TaxID=2983214 RepID=UPI0023F7CA65|nr:BspA family leucine-rich repeat surface protein [Bifidobacterium sp. ESL0690]WEV46727.1 BspA family leucine-rich repeat surface protein [Bifidobacterium sp. ESL0690]
MHSHGNRTPPPQNEPSLNNPANPGTAASSQTVASNSSVAPTSTSVSASSTIQTQASLASSSSTVTTQPNNSNTKNTGRRIDKDAKTMPTASLTHTNAAATPTAKPKTLSTLATKDFSDASKTLATFLQQIKQPSRHGISSHRTKPAATIESRSSTTATLPRATATLPSSQSPVGIKPVFPLTREAPKATPQDEPTVGPQGGGGAIRLSTFRVDPYDDGHIQLAGTADTIYGMETWVNIAVCPAGTSNPNFTENGPSAPGCSNIEAIRDGGGQDNFSWYGNEFIRDPNWTTRDSSFMNGPGYYDIWAATRTSGFGISIPVIVHSNYYCSRGQTYVTLKYDMSSMTGASTPDSVTVNTTDEAKSITLAGAPSHSPWQVFDGWYVNYSSYNAGQSVTFGHQANGTYTVTPRWHIHYTGLSVYYNLNGMPATQPGSQYADTTYNSASLTVGGTPSNISSWAAFDGWYLNTDGTGTNYQGRSLSGGYQYDTNYTLYAKWHALPTNITITYDMGETGCNKPADQHPDSTGKTGTATTTLADTPSSCPAHTAFDGWTINGTDYAPGGTFTYPRHSTDTYTATARTHTVQAPTNLTATYHITGTVTLTGTANVQAGDKITACMTEGTGDTACQPAITATANNSAWNWTITFPATDYTTKYGYGYQHHFTAKLTQNNADSIPADLKGTLPWTTLSFDKGTSGGTAPGPKDALTDTASGKATFTLPGQGSMTVPEYAWPDFTGWTNGTTLWQPGSRDIPTNTTGTSTDANGHTTLTLTAQWHTVTAPTGVTVHYSHANNYIYLTATGLQAGVTDWQILVKPTATSSYQPTSKTSTTGQSYYYNYDGAFTPGATWTARARAIYTNPSGVSVTSDWSAEFTGILPYMDATLKPGTGTGTDAHAKGLVDPNDHNAYLTLPTAIDKSMAPPSATMNFDRWDTRPDGTGTPYPIGQAVIPTSLGTPDGPATDVTLYAQWKQSTPTATPGNCEAGGWNTWGTPAADTGGLAPPDSRAVCWTIDNGTVLRLSGGTAPDYKHNTDIPWNGQKNTITAISIEGDLTLAGKNSMMISPFNTMGALTTLTNGRHTVSLARWAGNDLFDGDEALTGLDLSGWDVSHNTNMNTMFSRCKNMKTLTGIAGWQTGNVTNMSQMFDTCQKLATLDLSGWDTHSVTSMRYTFGGCDKLVDLDLSGWDTRNVPGGYFTINYMLPANLQRLRLGPNTQLHNTDPSSQYGNGDPFASLNATHAWHEWDWPKGHHPADLGLVGATSGTPGDGTLNTLRDRAASATPQGTYIRDDVNPTWTDLTYNLNGGTGDNALPTQIGQAATGSTPKRDGLAIDTTFKDGQYTTASATHITGNKPHSLFNGWTIDTGNVTGGTATVSNHTITAPKGAGGTAAITAQWNPAPQAIPGTPTVSVAPRTTDQGGVNVSVTATLGQALPAITGNGNDPAKPAVDAGGTVKICAKPSSQNDDYTPGQCQSKASTTAGSQTITPDPFTLPGSLTGGQATTFPTPGEAYTMTAMYTLTDPQTRNQIDSSATQAGGGSVTSTLPWVDTTFDTNDSHGGTGTPPTDAKSFVDTASGKAWIALPNATGTMKPEHFAFAGWTTIPANEQPDQGMNDPSNRDIQLDATGTTETQTTLYAVWHKLATPTTVTGITRDHMTNTVTVTGTSTPWTSEDDVTVDLVPLDGQDGLTPAGARHATISPTDQHGATLAYDGHTAHPWSITLTPSDLASGGRYRTTAKLEAHDHAWRDTNADLHVYSEPDQQNQPAIDGYFHHALPLTGGQRTMLIIALTLLGVFLIGMSQLTRNRRRWHHQ